MGRQGLHRRIAGTGPFTGEPASGSNAEVPAQEVAEESFTVKKEL